MQNASRSFAFIGGFRAALTASLFVLLICIGSPAAASAQEAAQGPVSPAVASNPVVPQQVRYAGKLATRTGETLEAEFRIYAAAEGGDPLWTETQRVTVAEDGSYSVLLGSASPTGLPQKVFAGGAARWLGVSVERAAEQDRVLLSSVPYAMKSADAESLAGHVASDFVTQEQLAQLTTHSEIPATADPEAQSNGSGPVSGLGTTGTVPIWTGANALGNSVITQLGSNIGINLAAPSATLDVAGSATIRGTLSVGPVAPATTAAGQNSQHLNLTADAWSTATNSALAQTFDWVAAAVGNNTATPSGALYLQFQSGAAPRVNLFNINSAGIINWAPGQTFPGTIGSVTATSPVTATTASGAVSVGLNTSALETTLNSVYPQLSAANTFIGDQKITGNATVSGSLSAGNATLGNTTTGSLFAAGKLLGTYSVSAQPTGTATASGGFDTFLQSIVSVYNSGTSTASSPWLAWHAVPVGNNTASPGIGLDFAYGPGNGTFNNTGLSINQSGQITFASGQAFPGTGPGTITGITTSSPLTGSGTSGSVALGLNESALATAITPTLETTFNVLYPQLAATANAFTGEISAQAQSSNGGAVYGDAALVPGAYGVEGQSDTSFGVVGETDNPANGASGVFGGTLNVLSGNSQTLKTNYAAGVWGDTDGNNNGLAAGVIGTADNHSAGVFQNTSTTYQTIYADNTAAGTSASSGNFPTAIFATTSGNYGNSVNAYATGLNARALVGIASNNGSTAIYGESDGAVNGSTDPIGVKGTATGSDGDGMVADETGASGGYGLYAHASGVYDSARGFGAGVYALGNNGYGVLGVDGGVSSLGTNTANAFGAAGVWGDTNVPYTSSAFTSLAGVAGTAENNYAGYFANDSSTILASTVYIENTSTTSGAYVFQTIGNVGTAGNSCTIDGKSNLSCSGTVSAVIKAADGAHSVETYAVQSPENWMEDFGTGTLERGVAVVKIDPAFADTVSANAEYHVFLTPKGDSEGLYVINETPTSFEVRESKGGTSSLSFDYRIVAKRRGYEGQRLVDVTDRFTVRRPEVSRHKAAPAINAELEPQIVEPRPASARPSLRPQVREAGGNTSAAQ